MVFQVSGSAVLKLGAVVVGRQREGADGHLLLATQAQRFPAGDKYYDLWSSSEQITDHGGGVKQVFIVVQHEHEVFGGKGDGDHVGQGAIAPFAEPQGPSHGW